LIREWNGTDLIPQNNKGWTYFTSPTWVEGIHSSAGWNNEPTHSQVNYVDGLLGGNFKDSTSTQLKIDVVPTLTPNDPKSTINSVRLTTVQSFDNGLFIIDLDQIPHGQWFWPAFWLLGETISPDAWAMAGEIDIIEGGWFDYNNPLSSINTTSLHTNDINGKSCNGDWKYPDGSTPICSAGDASKKYCGEGGKYICPFDGCAFQFPNNYSNSFGKGLLPGSMFAVHLSTDGSVKLWFFTPNKKPILGDIVDLSDKTIWPTENPSDNSFLYQSISTSCTNNFKNMKLIINTVIGGDAFHSGRASNPTFNEAYSSAQQAISDKTSQWIINSIKIYQ
jgi:hypothetical protein